MFAFKPRTMDELRAEAEANGLAPPARSVDATRAMAEGVVPRPVNVRQVLDLGALIFFQWRGRMYGVPPLPWKAGAALLDAYMEARSYPQDAKPEDARAYYKALNRISRIMWRYTRRVHRVHRLLHWLRIDHNHYKRMATEGELAELARFFLGRRMIVHDSPTPSLPNLMI